MSHDQVGLGPDFWSGPDRIVLAPMEGVVDWVIRDLLTRIGGIDLCVTEFIRVTDRALPDGAFFKDCPELNSESKTRAGIPVLVQLLGGQAGPMAESAKRACDLGAFGIDLNFGCPAKTVNRHDGGATLLKNPERVFEVVKAVRAAVPAHLTVSAKVRLGFSDKVFHKEIAQAAQEGGAAWLTVHARTRDEGYRPPAHWDYIHRMREGLQIPVLANGDIWTIEDYDLARSVSGCRHVMIGRGLMSDPGLALRIKNRELTLQTPSVVANWIAEFAQMSEDYREEHYAVCRTKQWLKSLSKRYDSVGPLFENIKRLERIAPILEATRQMCEQ